MTTRVGINGFGRIGRQSLKAILERTTDIEVVAVNDLVSTELNALLFQRDSTYGKYDGTVEHTADTLIVDGKEIKVLAEKEPAKLPWGDLGVDIVIESTGRFTDATAAAGHIEGGARKVLISAPAKNEDVLHERPERPRRGAQGPPARPLGRPEHHPHDDGSRQGARARHPRPQGQVRRLQPARAHADGERRRLHGAAREAGHGG
jgi:hypothetical protein